VEWEIAVDLPPGLRLSIEDQPSAADINFVGTALDAYNREFLGDTGYSRMGLFVRNEGGEVRAGLVGSIYASWLFVADLWVHADLRRRGIGSHLLALAERRAIELGCHSAMLDTFSFQGPAFYPRFGYQLYGALDYPPRHRRYFLWKPLRPDGAGSFVKLFPVSVKGVLFEADRVVLLENERRQWELPGGRPQTGEEPAACLVREVTEELGIVVAVETILDSWVYEVLPGREVLIVTYGVQRTDWRPMRVSAEHQRIGLFTLDEIGGLPIAEGYRRSIRAWAAQRGTC
jgi:8-oxo-dGTP pyrophosphatase MutT (NUDIX family)/GNAT superfamily N-acetyltransferase